MKEYADLLMTPNSYNYMSPQNETCLNVSVSLKDDNFGDDYDLFNTSSANGLFFCLFLGGVFTNALANKLGGISLFRNHIHVLKKVYIFLFGEVYSGNMCSVAKTDLYSNKYMDKYNRMKDREELTDEQKNALFRSVLYENTPNGNVLMYYDNKQESFVYYSDNTIPYTDLETVSRRYVINNNCKQLYINSNECVALEKNENTHTGHVDSVEKINKVGPANSITNKYKQNNVFAKLKNYQINAKPNTTIPSEKRSIRESINTNTADNIHKLNPSTIKLRINRYIYEGRLSNYSFLVKPSKEIINKNYKLTFAEFKKTQRLCENKTET